MIASIHRNLEHLTILQGYKYRSTSTISVLILSQRRYQHDSKKHFQEFDSDDLELSLDGFHIPPEEVGILNSDDIIDVKLAICAAPESSEEKSRLLYQPLHMALSCAPMPICQRIKWEQMCIILTRDIYLVMYTTPNKMMWRWWFSPAQIPGSSGRELVVSYRSCDGEACQPKYAVCSVQEFSTYTRLIGCHINVLGLVSKLLTSLCLAFNFILRFSA